jgi:hypothetical protein
VKEFIWKRNMIGRLKPILNVLTTEDHVFYKAHYCGLCWVTKEAYGIRATLGHSSEMVFVSVILEGLAEEAYRLERAGCCIFPPIRRNVVMSPPEHQRALASGVLATLQLDLKDAREDRERRLKQLLCKKYTAMKGDIIPESARQESFVQKALRQLPKDEVGELVAGVVGSVFALAGYDGRILESGCQIGYALGRLMSLSDAAEDYFQDLFAGRSNVLAPIEGVSDVYWVEDELHGVLDEINDLLSRLPLRRNTKVLDSLINVHARARANVVIQKFLKKLKTYESSLTNTHRTLWPV